MNLESFLKSLDDSEKRDLLGVIPDDLLRDEAVNRGMIGAEDLGRMAVIQVDTEEELTEEDIFEADIKDYLDPQVEIDALGQLDILTQFWNKLGYQLPTDLGDRQLKNVQGTIEIFPHLRLLAAPLLNFDGRKEIVQKASDFQKNSFGINPDNLLTPDIKGSKGKLLRVPDVVASERHQKYAMRYKLDSGELVSRDGYLSYLKDSHQVVRSEQGYLWTYVAIDINEGTSHGGQNIKTLYGFINPLATPETLLAIQLMRQANGNPSSNWQIDLANEAVWDFSKDDHLKDLKRVAGIGWDPKSSQVRLDYFSINANPGSFRTREIRKFFFKDSIF